MYKEIENVSGVRLNDLHRQHMDRVVFNCSCGGVMKRVSEVLDCWFESGAVPFAQKQQPPLLAGKGEGANCQITQKALVMGTQRGVGGGGGGSTGWAILQ